MGLFDINDEKLQAIMQYARENGCSYDQALIFAKTGNKMFQEAISTILIVDVHPEIEGLMRSWHA